MRLADGNPDLGIAHFTVIEVPPLDLVGLAAEIGYRSIGLRLHPAFAGAPCYEISAGSAAMREMKRRLGDAGISVRDIEFVTVDAGFVPSGLGAMLESASVLGAERLSVCGDDPDRARLVATFAALCELASGFGMGVDLECMAWREVASLQDAVAVAQAAGQANGGVLVDALHLSRAGGSPGDVKAVPAAVLRCAQLCDAALQHPVTTEAIIREARSGRLPPGAGALRLRELLAALPTGTALSVEVPMAPSEPPEPHARRVYAATQELFENCRRDEAESEEI